MSAPISLRPAPCPPRKRLEGFVRADFVRMILWHERKAREAMDALHCGSENSDYAFAHRIANAHWCAAALLRLHIGSET